MPVTPGAKLGPYEILSPIGAGGMGEVYRARDTKLDRDVAIKVLPSELAEDEDRIARFEREAKLLASLNHPNIAGIYGFESGALVLELVEGPTLAERIERGPIPVDEAIAIAKQIAAALEAGHEAGVIHRDLKPANVKVKEDGTVKVLDYGLAKALEVDAPNVPDSELSQSPTQVRQGTRVGVIMGTAAYMSPEQARGKEVDKRTDIWAFGCCLYESLTGRAAFGGETVTDILAAVVEREPEYDRLPSKTPSSVRRLLHRCFEKNPRERLRDIGDARLEVKDALDAPLPVSPVASRTPLMAMALVTLAALGVALWSLTRDVAHPATAPAHFALPLPADHTLGITNGAPALAVSRDGRQFVWSSSAGNTQRLYLRSASELEPVAMEGTEGAVAPFFSPDGGWLGFATLGLSADTASQGITALPRNVIWKVSVNGGAPVKVVEFVGAYRGATWAPDGSIIFSAADRLQQVASEGGEPTVLAAPAPEQREKSFRFPDALPGRHAVIVTRGTADMETWDDATIAVLTLDDGEIHTLVEGGTNGRYSETGHIVYVRGERLFAVPFDADSLEVTGAPVVVLEPVSSFPDNGPAQFALAADGSLLYAPGRAWTSTGRAVTVSRNGTVEPLLEMTRSIRSLSIAPDGGRVAIELQGANHSIWMYDFARGTLTPFLSGFNNFDPLWSPAGNELAWGHDAGGIFAVFRISADGTGERERLTPADGRSAQPEAWSPDGRSLLYRIDGPGTGGGDLMVLSLEDRTHRVFVGTDADERQARFSPDGRWVAHMSDASGRPEIYLRSFEKNGPTWQVSVEGGDFPRWSPRGRELFFRSGDKMMAVAIELSDVPQLGRPYMLFEKHFRAVGRVDYDVMADGERFVVTDLAETVPPPRGLAVFQNFAEELKRLVPRSN